MTLSAKDLAAVLQAVHAINHAPDRDLIRTTLRAAARLVGCDTVSYNEQDATLQRTRRFHIEPRYVERRPMDAYRKLVWQHPTFEAYRSGRLHRGRCVSISDLVSVRSFRRLPLYAEFYRDREVEDQLVAVAAERHGGDVHSLVFSRSRRGFSARDRAVVDALAPHLHQAVRQQDRMARLAAAVTAHRQNRPEARGWDTLTPRERDVVQCLSTGAADHQIARSLGISPRTVGKHLENVYRKLNLSGRSGLLANLALRSP
jgi:DNA-binding CsgD family transcriptional regulator